MKIYETRRLYKLEDGTEKAAAAGDNNLLSCRIRDS